MYVVTKDVVCARAHVYPFIRYAYQKVSVAKLQIAKDRRYLVPILHHIIYVDMLLICPQSQRRCFDVYVVHLESVELEAGSGVSGLHELIESEPIIPSVDDSGDGIARLTLNVTTNSTLGTNMFYRATLITTMDTMEAGSIRLCKCIPCVPWYNSCN